MFLPQSYEYYFKSKIKEDIHIFSSLSKVFFKIKFNKESLKFHMDCWNCKN